MSPGSQPLPLPALQTIALPTGPVAYRRAGQGPPLLLLHGWGGSSRHWLGAFAALSAHHDVVALDLPGFGASPPPEAPFTLGGLAATIGACADALSLQRFALGGHSLGAALALLVASARPEAVARLALVSFGLPRDPLEALWMARLHLSLQVSAALWGPWLALWRPWLAAARPFAQLAWTTPPLPALLASPLLRRPAALPPALLAIGAAELVAMDARVGLEAACTAGDLSVAAAAPRAAAPTLVISGAADPLFPPSTARALADTLPHAGLVLIEECGHIPMAEAPAALFGALGAFLAM